jgi:hypothetical protein
MAYPQPGLASSVDIDTFMAEKATKTLKSFRIFHIIIYVRVRGTRENETLMGKMEKTEGAQSR